MLDLNGDNQHEIPTMKMTVCILALVPSSIIFRLLDQTHALLKLKMKRNESNESPQKPKTDSNLFLQFYHFIVVRVISSARPTRVQL